MGRPRGLAKRVAEATVPGQPTKKQALLSFFETGSQAPSTPSTTASATLSESAASSSGDNLAAEPHVDDMFGPFHDHGGSVCASDTTAAEEADTSATAMPSPGAEALAGPDVPSGQPDRVFATAPSDEDDLPARMNAIANDNIGEYVREHLGTKP